jgi:hypothetical protein
MDAWFTYPVSVLYDATCSGIETRAGVYDNVRNARQSRSPARRRGFQRVRIALGVSDLGLKG